MLTPSPNGARWPEPEPLANPGRFNDERIRPRQSQHLAEHRHAAAVPATLITVAGTGHTIDTPTQEPAPGQLTAMVADFFTTTLR